MLRASEVLHHEDGSWIWRSVPTAASEPDLPPARQRTPPDSPRRGRAQVPARRGSHERHDVGASRLRRGFRGSGTPETIVGDVAREELTPIEVQDYGPAIPPAWRKSGHLDARSEEPRPEPHRRREGDVRDVMDLMTGFDPSRLRS
jgi:hypothetical protein